MKFFNHNITVLTVFLLLIQQVLSGCATMTSKSIEDKNASTSGKYVFQVKCSKCHELPDIEAYPYSSDDWAKIVDSMLETKEAEQYITIEEAEKIKSYLRSHSISDYKPLLNEEWKM